MNTLLIAAAKVREDAEPASHELQYLGTEALIGGNTLAVLAGLTSGTAINNAGGFLKFLRDGKIRYVATKPFRHSVSWNQLNAIGLVSGSKVVSIDGQSYRVRLLTGGNGNPSSAAGGEWDELIYAVCSGRPGSYTGPRLAELSVATLYIGEGSTIRSTICQETQNGVPGNCIRRGRDNTQYYAGLPKTDNGNTVLWRPVLEPVE